jgi:hypothetical protein
MSEAPRVELPAEPEWVQRMRAAGYNIRIGTGEGTMSEIPDAYFYPPPSLRSRIRGRIVRACKRMVHALTSARRTTHAPFP